VAKDGKVLWEEGSLTLWPEGDHFTGFARDERTDESARSGLPDIVSLRRVK
jgi:hypothetical protein